MSVYVGKRNVILLLLAALGATKHTEIRLLPLVTNEAISAFNDNASTQTKPF
jgi:7-cyano-7-deazaguanine synthase in queuosine biosynthesis